jgi:hypothetical protein
MKKLLLFLFLLPAAIAYPQLPNGSTAPDFTLTDINGSAHNLYTYLAQGKTVYIDFFACHCPICWGYHNQHELNTLVAQHGPGGSISNDVVVLGIEYDANNGNNEFYGISGNTQGNWVSGTLYPLINPEGQDRNNILSGYAVNYFPLVYGICPDKSITVLGTQTASQLYAHTAACNAATGISSTRSAGVFFNFANDKLNVVSNSSESFLLTVYTMDGRMILKEEINPGLAYIPFETYSSGIYLCEYTDRGKVIYSKFVK